MTAARLYCLLVRLHPVGFRERFGAEMRCIFDEVDVIERPRLFRDCLLSLARQWLLRSGYWKIAAAAVGAVAQMAAAMWLASAAGRKALAANAWREDQSMPMGGAFLLVSGILTAMLLSIMIAAVMIARKTAGIRRRRRRREGVSK
jgi:hypothetical protein